MKKIVSLLILSAFVISCGTTKTTAVKSANNTPIKTTLNLTKVVNDKVPVTINPGEFQTDNVVYRLPKVVQGTYAISDFGKYIDSFKALDYNNKELVVNKLDNSSWEIKNATKLDKITYLVNDTFDSESTVKENKIFSPSGTNIDDDNYVLNLFGFVGYFDSLKNAQYALDIISPTKTDYKRSSALKSTGSKINTDKTTTTSYFANRYFDIADNPMMYGNLDVEEFPLDDIKITLSVYSPNGTHSAKEIGKAMKTMMLAQKKYLGDVNATSHYHIFLFLAAQNETAPTGFGALEHHTSTTVVMPEAMPVSALIKSLVDIVSHEFFHIVTPLSVHSEDVHYFDYHKPTFSKHLWMYEGVTEYFATLFQVNQGLVDEAEFYSKIMGKIQTASGMNDAMSFTKMSENILDEPYKAQYGNVYQKGALIGMCIDIILREESNGHRGILSLMKELSLKYGKNKPFEDDKLIEEITTMTYPSIGEFLQTHVVGDTPINYNDFFAKAGLTVKESKVKTNYIQNDGALILTGSPDKGIFFTDLVSANSFWHEQGAKPNDIIKKINGQEVTLQNANQIFGLVFNWQPGTDIDVVLEREGKEINIKTKTTQSYTIGKGLQLDDNATIKQKELLKAWLKG